MKYQIPQNIITALQNRRFLTIKELSTITSHQPNYLREILHVLHTYDKVKYWNFDGVYKISLADQND